MMPYKKYFMIKNAFNDFQCLLCFKTFEVKRLNCLKRHFDHFHNDIQQYEVKERENQYMIKKKFYLDSLKHWVSQEEEHEDRIEEELKIEISNLLTLEIVKQGRPFSDGAFIKMLLNAVLEKLKINCSVIKTLPMSRNSVVKRTSILGAQLESVIREKLKNCEYFSFCLDESTDINDLCQLVICVRCIDSEYNVFESMYSLETFYGNVTGKVLYDVVFETLLSTTQTSKLAGVCTDGANVMAGKYEGFVGQLKQNGIEVHAFHCIIHQSMLASKFISEHAAMKTAERIINRIRGGHHSLTHRKFVSFLKNANVNHHDLKMFTEVRWLSRGNCLNRLFDIRKEVLGFWETENLDECELKQLNDYEFILDLAFLADTSSILNELNLELQGKGKNLSDIYTIVFNFKTKLFLLINEINNEDFSNFPKTLLIYEKEKYLKKSEHLAIFETLFYNFQDRFQDFEDIKPLLNIFQNPFKCDVGNYEFSIQSELIILKSEFNPPDRENIVEFWKNLDGALYPALKKNSFKCLSLFSSTYLCEQIFSDMKYICSKQRNKLTSANLKNILLLRNCNINLEDIIGK